MKKFTKNGFTLIELLVVIAIIAILALIVLLALNPVEMQRRSRDSRRLSDMGTLRRAIDLSLADGKTLDIVDWTTINSGTSVTQFGKSALGTGTDISKYLSVVPQDPISDGTGTTQYIVGPVAPATVCSITTGVADSSLVYEFKSDGSNYELRSRIESIENCGAVKNDGNNDGYYELGTNPGMTW